jgi:hypothetical protein
MTNDGAFFAFQSLLYAPAGVDLAILKFSAHDASWLKLENSDTVAEGQRVLVIGNPTGLQRTVSDGLIAAFRENHALIQITAPVSPGSSGSPVLDESGLVVGVARFNASRRPESEFCYRCRSSHRSSQFHDCATTGCTVLHSVGFFRAQSRACASAIKTDLNDFIRGFVTAGNYNDPVAESSYCADEVDYFDNGRVNRGFVINDIKSYDQRWPKRSYWLGGDPSIRIVDSQGDLVQATVTLKFSAQNSRKGISGSCEDTILVRDASTNPRVISIKTRILSRHENQD